MTAVCCTECGKQRDPITTRGHGGRGLCGGCYARHRLREDVPWARELAKRRLKRQSDYTAAKGAAVVICALENCTNEVKGRNKQFCSWDCAKERIDSRMAPMLAAKAKDIWDMRCMMCGRAVDPKDVAQARTHLRCDICGGRLLFERNDVGGASSIGADTPLRPRTTSVPKRMHG